MIIYDHIFYPVISTVRISNMVEKLRVDLTVDLTGGQRIPEHGTDRQLKTLQILQRQPWLIGTIVSMAFFAW